MDDGAAVNVTGEYFSRCWRMMRVMLKWRRVLGMARLCEGGGSSLLNVSGRATHVTINDKTTRHVRQTVMMQVLMMLLCSVGEVHSHRCLYQRDLKSCQPFESAYADTGITR